MNKDKAVEIIIRFETSPLQLHNKRYEYNRAKELIENLHGPAKREAEAEIEKAFDKYHKPIPGMDDSPYDMDQLMMYGS